METELAKEAKGTAFITVHRVLGISGIVVFLGTGIYMRTAQNGLQGLDALPRMLFRSAHIYLLLASLINLALGLSPARSYTKLQTIGSILILIAPAFMLTAFFVEPGLESFERPFAGPGIYSLFAGMLLHLAAHLRAS